ncbi:MAG: methanogenesis marker 3 protein, partial [Methanomassiliicoccales archaeon]|nr:methanogenesis marker 3 protein [Methanomassiliicoccales archaeon]
MSIIQADQMNVTVNGETRRVKEGATLADALEGQPYAKGCAVAVSRSADVMRKETNDFEIVTPHGRIGLRLNDSPFAGVFRELNKDVVGRSIRWQTSKVLAVGSFPSGIEVSRDRAAYRKFDCFFATGGFDAKTTYVMIARMSHEGQYGTAGAVFGKITTGRHILNELREGEKFLEIRPLVEELVEKRAFVTDDLGLKLEEGMQIDSFVGIGLDRRSPVSCEHFLVITEKGVMDVTDKTATYAACSSNLDVSLIEEASGIREEGTVTVRHEGSGNGRIYIYESRRQVSNAHNVIGKVTQGLELARLAPSQSKVTVVPDPKRIMVIGLTQSEGQKALEARGLRQRRSGVTSDEAVIVEQEPELTMEALHEAEIETLGAEPEKVNLIHLSGEKAPQTRRYFRKLTGLNHKPVGTMKVHFTYPEMPLITFEGDPKDGASLVP